jgi:hypothetical protein
MTAGTPGASSAPGGSSGTPQQPNGFGVGVVATSSTVVVAPVPPWGRPNAGASSQAPVIARTNPTGAGLQFGGPGGQSGTPPRPTGFGVGTLPQSTTPGKYSLDGK